MMHQMAGGTVESDKRKKAAAAWAAGILGRKDVELRPVSGDASFRRYFRLHDGERSVILMDAPPDREDSAPFVDIAQRIRSAGLNAPKILHFDLELGFGLLEDFGDTLYRELIDAASVDDVFPDLFGLLKGLARHVDPTGLPVYDSALFQKELNLFTDWYLARHKEYALRDAESRLWDDLCGRLIDSALQQPQVFVHKDFHSCNLLQTAAGPGIIDFQDGVRGPISYDFVSLVWDRYVAWPRKRLENWMQEIHSLLDLQVSTGAWVRCCDLMGLQRNLKIVGIFARLNYRDQKDGYLQMIPRFYQYLMDVLPRYPEFEEFKQLLENPRCAP